MSDDNVIRETFIVRAASCFGWLLLFGLLGALATAAVGVACAKWGERYASRRSHTAMIEQMDQIKRGEIDCLVQPDPRFIDELMADKDCTTKICEIDLRGDVSDQRLGRLRELPNVRCIVLLFAGEPDAFLERLHGMASVEQLTLEYTAPSRRGIESIGKFPKLKSLCLPVDAKKLGDLHGIESHPRIENLVLTRIVECDKRLLPILQSLPRLRTVKLEGVDDPAEAESFEKNLRKALPHCQCTVRTGA
jgi:hypothetical protein